MAFSKSHIKSDINKDLLLIRNVPPLIFCIFVLSVVLMNIFAAKEFVTTSWFAMDCGLVLSWIPCLFMDVVCRHYGPKEAFKLSLLAIAVNIVVALVIFLLTLTPGHWGEYYTFLHHSQQAAEIADESINSTLGVSWYIVLCSMFCMAVSSAVNSGVNYLVSLLDKSRGFLNFARRSYVSTAVAQLVDNFLFALIVSHMLFGWTWVQMLSNAFFAAAFELGCEILMSPLGYKLLCAWQRDNIGHEYLEFKAKLQQ